MNYYSHHIGDFDRATRHLTRTERSIYLDLIFVYYDTEAPLTKELAPLCRKIMAKTEEEKAAVIAILDEFFVDTPAGWFHARCEEELDAYRKSNSQRSAAGKASAAARAARLERASNGISTSVERDVEQASNERSTNQEPITNNQIKEPTSSSGDDLRACPIGSLVNLYHEMMPANPRVKVVNKARQSAIRQRWIEAAGMSCKPFGYQTKAEGLEAWRNFFAICAESDFLTGRAPASAGRPAFIADIDFLFSPSGFARTLENKYHRGAA